MISGTIISSDNLFVKKGPGQQKKAILADKAAL